MYCCDACVRIGAEDVQEALKTGPVNAFGVEALYFSQANILPEYPEGQL